MLKITAIGCRVITVTAAVAADLANKEGYIVEQIAAAETVQLFTTGIPYAVLGERIQGGSQWNAYLIGGGGIAPVVCGAGGVGALPAYVKAANGGKAVASSSTNLSIGIKRDPAGAVADGEVMGVDLALVAMP